FLYDNLRVWSSYLGSHRGVLVGIILAVVAGLGLLCYWIINKPRSADFLIATDSEMKKVNWTSRRELIGSTKVGIFFLLIITAFLFVIDVIFGYAFYFFGVLKTKPF